MSRFTSPSIHYIHHHFKNEISSFQVVSSQQLVVFPSHGFGHFISNSDLFHLKDHLVASLVKYPYTISLPSFPFLHRIKEFGFTFIIGLFVKLYRAVVSFTGMSKISQFMCYCRTSFFSCLCALWNHGKY